MNNKLRITVVAVGVFILGVLMPAGFGQFVFLNSGIGYAEGFWIDQQASTSEGTVQRHGDISSPWSGAYIYEDSTMVGRVEIRDSFSMSNIGTPPSNSSATGDFFDIGGNSSDSANNSSSEQSLSNSSAGKKIPEPEQVLGISIHANLNWLDLF